MSNQLIDALDTKFLVIDVIGQMSSGIFELHISHKIRIRMQQVLLISNFIVFNLKILSCQLC